MSVTLALIPVAIAVAGAIASREDKPRDVPNSFRLGTRIKDEGLLQAALENCGCKAVEVEETIDSTMNGTRILFERDEQGTFEAVFVGDIPVEEAQTFLTELDEEYALLVQQQVYQNLLLRARERGLVMESEEVQEDNSIIITFTV